MCARNFWQRKSDCIFQSRFNPLEVTFLGFFGRFCAKLNDLLFFKKIRPPKFFFTP